MLFISQLVRMTVKHVLPFWIFRILWSFALVLPLIIYVNDRFNTRAKMQAENMSILLFVQICVGITMIFSPILLINLAVGIMRMLIMPHLSLIFGLTIGTIISIIVKVGGLVALGILAEDYGAFSQGLSIFLTLQCALAFVPMAMKILINRTCLKHQNKIQDNQQAGTVQYILK